MTDTSGAINTQYSGDTTPDSTTGPIGGYPANYGKIISRAPVQMPGGQYGFMAPDVRNGPTSSQDMYYTGAERSVPMQLSQETRAELQLTLKQMGLIGKNVTIQPGAWDDASASAFKQVLSYANGLGVPWGTALQDMLDNQQQYAGINGGGGGGGALPSVHLTSPDDIAAVIREGAKTIYGSGNVDQAQVDKIVAGYHSQEAAASAGGTVTDPENLQNFVTDQLKAADPQKADARKVIGGLQQVHALLSGSGGANA